MRERKQLRGSERGARSGGGEREAGQEEEEGGRREQKGERPNQRGVRESDVWREMWQSETVRPG